MVTLVPDPEVLVYVTVCEELVVPTVREAKVKAEGNAVTVRAAPTTTLV